MNRIIINNKTDLSDIDSVEMIADIIKQGRCSNNNKQYCYLTSFESVKGNKKYQVATDLRKRSDSFTIIETNK